MLKEVVPGGARKFLQDKDTLLGKDFWTKKLDLKNTKFSQN